MTIMPIQGQIPNCQPVSNHRQKRFEHLFELLEFRIEGHIPLVFIPLGRQRARLYREALKTPENDLTPLYPLRFTRGAWNALKESGFLPQLTDVTFVYELLSLNEVIVVANKSLASVRSAKVGKNMKTKLVRSAKKAVKECTQIETSLESILVKMEKMKLPVIALPGNVDEDSGMDEEDDLEGKEENDQG